MYLLTPSMELRRCILSKPDVRHVIRSGWGPFLPAMDDR